MSELSAKTSHALGQLRTQRKNMLDAGIEQSVIDKLLSKQAEIHKMDLTELVKILDAKTAKGVNKDAESEETEKRFLVESQNLVVAMRNTTDNAITDSIASLGAIAKDYIIKCAIPSTHARKDWSRMVFLKVNPSGVMSLFFGGWKDSDTKLRKQFGIGRTAPFEPDDLSGDDIAKLVSLTIKGTTPYLTGTLVPKNKTTGYTIDVDNPTAEAEAIKSTLTAKQRKAEAKREAQKQAEARKHNANAMKDALKDMNS